MDKTKKSTDKRIIIFLGPSLNPEEALKILNADYRPPVGRDDVIKALQDKPDVIVIIDGVFHQKPAVSHKEILRALKEGVKVIGGASMFGELNITLSVPRRTSMLLSIISFIGGIPTDNAPFDLGHEVSEKITVFNVSYGLNR